MSEAAERVRDWRVSPAGRRFLEAAAIARTIEMISERVSGNGVASEAVLAELASDVGDVVAPLRRADLKKNFASDESRIVPAIWLEPMLATVAARAIYVVADGVAASKLLGAFLDRYVTDEVAIDMVSWTAMVGGKPRRRDRKETAAIFADRLRGRLQSLVQVWASPTLDPTALPPGGQRQAISQALEGRLLALAMSWRDETYVETDVALACEIDRWALGSILWGMYVSLATLSATDLEAQHAGARDAVLRIAMAGGQLTPFVPPPNNERQVVRPFLGRRDAEG